MRSFRVSLLLAASFSAALSAQELKAPLPAWVSDRVNAELPAWLRFSGEERARMEFITGSGFCDVDDLYVLNRLRLTVTVRPLPWLRFTAQSQDARVFGQNALPAPASQKDAMDLRLGYVEVGGDERPVTLRAGRQPLDFGEGRLVADAAWSNTGKSFDAARLTLRRKRLKLDLFSAALVKANQTNFNPRTPGEHFYGAYGSLGGLLPSVAIEPYVFWRLEQGWKGENGAPGKLDEKTFGLRWAGIASGGFDYTSEIAGQTGSSSGDGIRAWMGHWVVGRTFNERHHPRLFLEYNRASGDAQLKDHRYGTFDQLFPAGHDRYGMADLFGASNIVHLHPGVEYTVRPGLKVSASYNRFWLASATDGLYCGGRILARSIAGTAGTEIGGEADFQVLWTLASGTQVNAGYGRLFPGEFLRNTTAGIPYGIVILNVARRF